MKHKLAIIGASGHGKVIADIAEKCGYQDIVFLDDDRRITECAGFPCVGSTELLNQLHDYDIIIAIGNARIRQYFMEKVKTVTLIHPNACISRRVEIGEGCVIMGGTVINSDTVIGKGCIINSGATVDHDNTLGDYVHISVGAHLAGTVSVGNRTWIGAGAIVSNNIDICGDCMVGAGAVVVKTIEKAGTYIGVPARKI